MYNVWKAKKISFFFNDTATTEIYTLSLHDALPIYEAGIAYLYGGRIVVTVGHSLYARLAGIALHGLLSAVVTGIVRAVEVVNTVVATVIGVVTAVVRIDHYLVRSPLTVVLKIGRASCRERV